MLEDFYLSKILNKLNLSEDLKFKDTCKKEEIKLGIGKYVIIVVKKLLNKG